METAGVAITTIIICGVFISIFIMDILRKRHYNKMILNNSNIVNHCEKDSHGVHTWIIEDECFRCYYCKDEWRIRY